MLESRRQAREATLQALYHIDTLDHWTMPDIRQFFNHFYKLSDSDLDSNANFNFSRSLIEGIIKDKDRIDRLITEAAENWTLERMGRIDRNLLRLSVYEIIFCPETPANVIINEALEISKRFSGEQALNFINGVLDKVLKASGLPGRETVLSE